MNFIVTVTRSPGLESHITLIPRRFISLSLQTPQLSFWPVADRLGCWVRSCYHQLPPPRLCAESPLTRRDSWEHCGWTAASQTPPTQRYTAVRVSGDNKTGTQGDAKVKATTFPGSPELRYQDFQFQRSKLAESCAFACQVLPYTFCANLQVIWKVNYLTLGKDQHSCAPLELFFCFSKTPVFTRETRARRPRLWKREDYYISMTFHWRTVEPSYLLQLLNREVSKVKREQHIWQRRSRCGGSVQRGRDQHPSSRWELYRCRRREN